MPGKDENLTRDVQPYFTALRKIADDTGAAIVIIHHSNKVGGKNNFRGSSAIKGAVDLLVEVKSASGSNLIEFRTEKSRDTEAINFSANINFMTAVDPKMVWLDPTANLQSKGIQLGKADEFVLRYLFQNGASEKSTIESMADTCSSMAATKAIYRLADPKIGFIYRLSGSSKGGRGQKVIYDITDTGKNHAQFI